MGGGKVWIYFDRLAVLFDRLVVSARVQQQISVDTIDNQRQWIEFERPAYFGQRLIMAF